MKTLKTDVIGTAYSFESNAVDNATLISVNQLIRNHSIEYVGRTLRQAMTEMKVIKSEA
jgi:ketol-acid reductoisomerase